MLRGTTQLIHHFCTSCAALKMVPKNLKGKSKSSQDWLTRQLNDPYVKLAKHHQYRARSAFKLLEIDKRHQLLRPGQVVVECGASPGAWTQVAVAAVNSLPQDTDKRQGTVIGIDLQLIHPLPGATLLSGKDFTSPQTQQQVLHLLGGKKIDVVLSDMAPRASGIRELDQENIASLAHAALIFAMQNSAKGGSFLCKVWEGFRTNQLITNMKELYRTVKIVKPEASRDKLQTGLMQWVNETPVNNTPTLYCSITCKTAPHHTMYNVLPGNLPRDGVMGPP